MNNYHARIYCSLINRDIANEFDYRFFVALGSYFEEKNSFHQIMGRWKKCMWFILWDNILEYRY